jgi:phosphonate transport system substrate-binding protein
MGYHTITNRSARRAAALLGAGALVAMLNPLGDAASAADGPLVLLIQPILSEEKTKEAYRPLCEYVQQVARRPCELKTQPNFLAYWDGIRRNNYDLVLDASHFTDYRVQKMGFSILAKIPDSVSYSLIVPDSNLVFDPAELVARRIATLGPPSIGAARLNAMYPNPLRQPQPVEVASAEEGMELLLAKKVDAAILPTPLVSQRMSQSGGIAVVLTTEPIPHIALSASPRVPQDLQQRIRDGLLKATETDAGRKMLKGIGFERFDPATPAIYANQGNILKTYWGY